MGGCYRTGSQPGSEICTAAEGGKCTECNADNGLFKNPAAAPDAGRECLLCWDTTGANGYKGVDKCTTCETPDKEGAATCIECRDGYFWDNSVKTCQACDEKCETCTNTGATNCKTCKPGTYLKGAQCIDGNSPKCDAGTYADSKSNKCMPCRIENCATCEYLDKINGPKCLTCNEPSTNLLKTEIDGTTSCVVAAKCAVASQPGTHFLSDSNDKCILCSDDKDGTETNKGTPGCRTCTKSGAKPTCSACLDGYFFESGSCVKKCDQSCKMCSAATDATKCESCYPGYFLVESTEPPGKKCVPCDDANSGGREGCSACSNTGGFKCTDCKANYQKEGSQDNYTCKKTCEDVTGCGGIAGACDAAVVDGSGNTKHYCSFCGESSKFPIDGVCVNTGSENGNTCKNGVCTQCTTGYFLYMGGCYSVSTAPGSHMCKTAGEGICTAPSEGSRYFVVPGATNQDQSVLACGNPVGTVTGNKAQSTKAYVGVDGCSQCTPPTDPAANGMMVATCTACEAPKKPTGNGVGCAACSDANCRHCKADEKCGTCNEGFSLEGGKCVSTGGPNLSTGAIAGIAVAAIVVVGGLVGFLCWWFICRGKA
ncbi:VSP [Giardia lamblia P15]|uniref:VSP n=1 Tax=Giardia intestinalis (strain P15) TaxID=658858 RepID=E1F5Z9_GIAIA|nr:VSP [Giardia lamblia P15]